MRRWTPERLLEHMRLKNLRLQEKTKIYVLGCTETRRVTMGSQQMRAVNLTHSLATQHFDAWKKGHLDKPAFYPGWNEKVLVIGGSAGGLTAAAHAAYRGATVVLLEAADKLMPSMDGSDRLLHPRLYEWGSPQPFEKNNSADYWMGPKVGLPLLDWEADPAHRVRARLLAEWEGWSDLYKIKVQMRTKVPPLAETNWPSADIDGSNFDHIIFATGFGVERRPTPPDWVEWLSGSYWQNDDLDRRVGDIVICGNGDGALTDLFRACLKGFQQAKFVDILSKADPDRALETRVLEIERKLESTASEGADLEMAKAFLALEAPRLDDDVEKMLRADVRVRLSTRTRTTPDGLPFSAEEAAFARAAFPLNRLLLASVLRVSRKRGNPPVSVVLTRERRDFPDPRGDGKESVVFRGGVEKFEARRGDRTLLVAPIDYLLGAAENDAVSDDLDDLRNRNKDKSEGDITRQPIWLFFGEAINPELPSAQAFIPAPAASEDQRVLEIYRDVNQFCIISDVFDSVFQNASDVSISAADEKYYFRGVIRLYSLVYNQIFLTDAQFWDGRFWLKFPDVWDEMNAYEQRLFQKKFVIRQRPFDKLGNVRDAFFLAHAGGAWKAREFNSSLLGPELVQKFMGWAKGGGTSLRPATPSAESVLTQFASDIGDSQDQERVKRIVDGWRRLDALVNGGNLHTESWPRPKTHGFRYWHHMQQLESPGLFYSGLPEKAREILLEAFKYERDSGARGVRTAYLKVKIEEFSAVDPDLAASVGQIQDWFDRAYNRMTARNQGANVFSSLRLGDTPGIHKSGTPHKVNVSLSTLGEMPSDAFQEISTKWDEKIGRRDGALSKPVTESFWDATLETLGTFLADVKTAPAIIPREGPGVDARAVQKMLRWSSIDSFKVGWVGDLDTGEPGETAARSVTTEGEEIGGDGLRPDESATEYFL
jgi:hypothetical protein